MACGLVEQPPEMQMIRRARFHGAYACLFSKPRERFYQAFKQMSNRHDENENDDDCCYGQANCC